MTIAESLLKEIDIGREGRAQGYSMGLPKLESIIDGVTKRTMTVLLLQVLVKVNLVLFYILMYIVL